MQRIFPFIVTNRAVVTLLCAVMFLLERVRGVATVATLALRARIGMPEVGKFETSGTGSRNQPCRER